MNTRARWIVLAAAAVIAIVLAIPAGGQTLGGRFFASLRIAKPKPVTAIAAAAGNSRQLQNVIAGILAETTGTAGVDLDTTIRGLDAASRTAGFEVLPLRGRTDPAVIEVLGGQTLALRVNASQVRTLFTEAGQSATVPSSVAGKMVTLARGRGVQLRYGHCPTPVAATLQNQLQGPPPPSTDNGNCVILTETPMASVSTPAGLDTAAVMEIALELSGMSPNQAHDFRRLFDWPAALDIAPPRALRSYDATHVGDAPGMLMISAGRREPGYTLAWVRDGIVFTLAGYGSSGDAVPLAATVR